MSMVLSTRMVASTESTDCNWIISDLALENLVELSLPPIRVELRLNPSDRHSV